MKIYKLFFILYLVYGSLHAKTDSVFTKIVGDTVQIWNINVFENCTSRYKLDIAVSGSSITVTETDTVGPLVYCTCNYELRGSLTGLVAGQYSAAVYRQELEKYFYPKDTVIFIDSVAFMIEKPSSLPISKDYKQSACNESLQSDYSYTAKYWYHTADSAAKKLICEATIMNISASEISLDGTSKSWTYKFLAYDSGKNCVEYLYFHSDKNGATYDSTSTFIVDGPSVITSNWFDSDSALEHAESVGSKTFRENNQNYTVSASLSEPLVPFSHPMWEVTYCSKEDSTVTLVLQFDARTEKDSLIDVFPLAIGNKWTYDYYRHDFNYVYESWDSGSVTIQVIDKIVTSDSIRWIMEQTNELCSRWYPNTYSDPVTTKDTVEIIELLQGDHALYFKENTSMKGPLIFRFSCQFDTLIRRYTKVDTAGENNRAVVVPFWATFTFKKGVGLSTYRFTDGCLCTVGYDGSSILRSYAVTDVRERNENFISFDYKLLQNYPNPFNPTTTISYSIPKSGMISLKVFDMLGREVETLVSEYKNQGTYDVRFEGSGLSSGIYFYKFSAGDFSLAKKMILLR